MGILSTDLVFLVSWFVFGGSIFSFVCLKSFFYGHVIVSKVINDPPEIVPKTRFFFFTAGRKRF